MVRNSTKCNVCFENVDEKVLRRSEGVALCLWVLDEANNRVPQDELYKEVGCGTQVCVQEEYKDSKVRCAVGVTDGFRSTDPL